MEIKEFIVKTLCNLEGANTESVEFDLAIKTGATGKVYVAENDSGTSRIKFSVTLKNGIGDE